MRQRSCAFFLFLPECLTFCFQLFIMKVPNKFHKAIVGIFFFYGKTIPFFGIYYSLYEFGKNANSR